MLVMASMGPPSLDGGEYDRARMSLYRTLRLQWGPRLSTGGRRKLMPQLLVRNLASMGPPSLDGGELLGGGYVVAKALVLQWGPRLSTGGSPMLHGDTSYQWQASMGPPSLDGGEHHGASKQVDRVVECFNGAPSLDGGESKPLRMQWPVGLALQWGPRLSTGGSRRVNPAVGGGRIGFNGAPVSRRGGAPNTLVFAKSLPRFNGAPVSRRGGV